MTRTHKIVNLIGVHAIGIAVSCITRGAVIRTLDERIDHPRPNSNGSVWQIRRSSSSRPTMPISWAITS